MRAYLKIHRTSTSLSLVGQHQRISAANDDQFLEIESIPSESLVIFARNSPIFSRHEF